MSNPCHMCKYFWEKKNLGVCRRYPIPQPEVSRYDRCGEFVEKGK